MPQADSSPAPAAPAGPAGGAGGIGRWLTGPLVAALLLAAFWGLLQASLWNKSVTHDEIVHAAGGYTYWHFNDYRIQPENGNLPERVAALPLLSGYLFPPRDAALWTVPDQWRLAERWFFGMGNDAVAMTRRGRAACGLFAVALGGLVWWWSRRLFGPTAGLVSLLLFVFSPTMLANGALMTSDAAAALFFLVATLAWWRLLHRVSPLAVLGCGLAAGALGLSKMSAPLFVPVALTLLAFRGLDGRPLPVVAGRWRREVAGRGRRLLVLAGAGAAQAVVAVALIWAAYGFRYSMLAPSDAGADWLAAEWQRVLDRPPPLTLLNHLGLTPAQLAAAPDVLAASGVQGNQWTPEAMAGLRRLREHVLAPADWSRLEAALAAPPTRLAPRLADFARRHRLLPEAYVYGYAYVRQSTLARTAFLNGRADVGGWWWFFPYAFLVKTPLPLFAVLLLALAGAVWRRRRRGPDAAGQATIRETLPLWTLGAVYWAAAMSSHMDIGHRHLLPTYAPLFVLGGAAAVGWGAATLDRVRAWALGLALAALAAETAARFPNYLAYFNVLAGGPAHGYRHLVDSSLDWGQDLPAAKLYLDRHPTGGRAYFSYFGTGSPDWYGIRARPLCSKPGLGQAEPPLFRFEAVPPGDLRAGAEAVRRQWPEYDLVGTVTTERGLRVVLIEQSSELRLHGGTYLISATLLQPARANFEGGLGPWNRAYEDGYQQLRRELTPFLEGDARARAAVVNDRSPAEWTDLLTSYEHLRFARLTAYLRRREPDATINYSILVYRLSDADLARALDGPPPELAPEPAWMRRKGAAPAP